MSIVWRIKGKLYSAERKYKTKRSADKRCADLIQNRGAMAATVKMGKDLWVVFVRYDS